MLNAILQSVARHASAVRFIRQLPRVHKTCMTYVEHYSLYVLKWRLFNGARPCVYNAFVTYGGRQKWQRSIHCRRSGFPCPVGILTQLQRRGLHCPLFARTNSLESNFSISINREPFRSIWAETETASCIFVFSARQHIACLARYMLSPFRLSVCPSVCMSIRRVYHRKRSQAVARIADRTASQQHYVSTVRKFDNPKIR